MSCIHYAIRKLWKSFGAWRAFIAIAAMAAHSSAFAGSVTYTSSVATVGGQQMTIWTKPTDNGGASQVASVAGKLSLVEHNTGNLVSFDPSGVGAISAVPSAGIDVRAVAAGLDNSTTWFAAFNKGIVGSVTGAGAFALNTTGAAALQSYGMTLDFLGNAWFATLAQGIGEFSLTGATTFVSINNNATQPTAVTLAGDGSIWFVEQSGSNVGRIVPTGVVTEFPAGFSGSSGSYGITTGPDGHIWFCDPVRKRIGSIRLDGSFLTYFTAGISGSPVSIVAGPDNQLYFGEAEGRIGRISTKGVVTEFPIPGYAGTSNFPVRGLTVGPGGSLWFVNDAHSQIGRLQLANASIDCVGKVWQSLEACGWAGPGNTGYPPGTVFKNTVGRTITADNTVIDGEKIIGGLYIGAKNVVVRNSWIISNFGGGLGSSGTGVINVQPGGSATITNNTLDGSNGTHAGIWHEGTKVVAKANNIFGVNDGLWAWDADNFSYQDNYLHNFTTLAANGHIDGFQTEGASHGLIRHNTFDVSQNQDSDVAIWDGRRNSDDITVENNLMAGGGFAVYAEDYSPSETNPQGGFTVTNIRILNNKFSTIHYPCGGYFGIWFPRGSPSDHWMRKGNFMLENWQNVDAGNPSVNGVPCN